MIENDASISQAGPGTPASADDTTPDSLMDHFKGKGLMPILVFTLIVHVVVIGGSSIPFFIRKAMGADNANKSEAERIESAVEDATAALRKIAKKHGLNPTDISDQFSGKGSRAAKVESGSASDGSTEAASAGVSDPLPEREKSAYETNLEVKVEGPSIPTFGEEDDDIF